jgi:uncharacterized SAM-binding protein YcdF (DUF218 family)
MQLVLKTLCLPPFNALALALCGVLLWRWRPRWGKSLVALAGVLLWCCSTPVLAALLFDSLQRRTSPLLAPQTVDAHAIVVLGADLRRRALEFGGESVGPFALERLRYGAALHKQTQCPLLITGGRHDRQNPSTAALMAQVLRDEFQVPVRWIEGRSQDTWQNAAESALILNEAGIQKIFLVTHAFHMPRARACFEAHGFEVVDAPTAFREAPRFSGGDFLPSWKALRDSALAWHGWAVGGTGGPTT